MRDHDAGFFDGVAQGGPFNTLSAQGGHVHTLERLGRTAQVICLGVVAVFEASTATGIGFAGAQKIFQPFGPADHIQCLEQFPHGLRFQLQSAVAVGVVFGHQRSGVSGVTGNPQAFRQGA